MATVGQALTAPEAGWQRFNDTDPNIKYEGAWALTTSYPSTWQSSITYSVVAGTKIKFNFIGTKLRIIGYNAGNRSTSIDVYIDGVLARNFSAYGTEIVQVLNVDISGLANIEHCVVIINNATGGYGNVFSLDAVDIDDTGILKPPSPVEPPATTNKAILNIELVDDLQKEYELTKAEVDAFIAWYNGRAAGNGSPYYVFDKKFNLGTFSSRKDHVAFDKIQNFEVMDFSK